MICRPGNNNFLLYWNSAESCDDDWIRSDERHFICTSIPFLIMHPRKKKNIPLTHWKASSRAKKIRRTEAFFFLFYLFHSHFYQSQLSYCLATEKRKEEKSRFWWLKWDFHFGNTKIYFILLKKLFISISILFPVLRRFFILYMNDIFNGEYWLIQISVSYFGKVMIFHLWILLLFFMLRQFHLL